MTPDARESALVDQTRPAARDLLGSAPSFSPWVWRSLAILIVLALSAAAQLRSSVVIDGVRHFWLDDDEMVSMRYARNLVDGAGLVFNAGERVEGYTNPLWTLAMAGVHLLPLGDAKIALAVAALNAVLAAVVLLLAERLLHSFGPLPRSAAPLLLLALAFCRDLLFWSSHGFETTLLTALFLLATARVLEDSSNGRDRIGTYLLAGLLPLVRSDGYVPWAAVAVLALGLSRRRPRTVGMLALSLALPVAHLLFRIAYYGEWVPNAYFLKVQGNPGLALAGLAYVWRFVRHYGVALAAAAVGAVWSKDRRRRLLLAGLALSSVFVVIVGGDMFEDSRFLAHFVPVALVLGLAASSTPAAPRAEPVRVFLCWAVALSVFFGVGVLNPSRLDDENGLPRRGVVAGVLIGRSTLPDARVAGFAAGCVPYFSRRYAIDLLGTTDATIAHGRGHPSPFIGHKKYDHDVNLRRKPDLIVTLVPHETVVQASHRDDAGDLGYSVELARNPTFRTEYLPNPVPIPILMKTCAVYMRSSSEERRRLDAWRAPIASP